MCFACPSHGLVNIPSSKSFSSPFLPGLLAQMYDERRVHHVHNKLSLSLSPAPLRSSLSTFGLLFLLSRFEISPSRQPLQASSRKALKGSRATETLAPGERTREGQRTEETSSEARRIEEQEEENRPTAPTLGKFGVTRGDEDKREELALTREEREEDRRRPTAKDEERICQEETIAHRGGPVIDSHTLRPPPPSKPGLFLCWITRRASNLPKRFACRSTEFTFGKQDYGYSGCVFERADVFRNETSEYSNAYSDKKLYVYIFDYL